jgi:hypothetical protein
MISAMQRPSGLHSAKAGPPTSDHRPQVSPLLSRRHLGLSLATGALLAATPRPAIATGLESIPLDIPPTPEIVLEIQRRNQGEIM